MKLKKKKQYSYFVLESEEKWKAKQYGSKFKETEQTTLLPGLQIWPCSNSHPTELARKSIFVITIDFQSFIIERT